MKRLFHNNLRSYPKAFGKVVILSLLLSRSLSGFSNNLSVSIVSGGVDQVAKTVTFNLSWDHAWRGEQSLASSNWDAAWVFVKFRTCGSSSYTHGVISTASTDHNFNGNNTSTMYFDPTLANGTTIAGQATDLAPNNTGVMLRYTNSTWVPSSSSFAGTVTNKVTLKVTNLPASGTNIDVHVYGIEMVFIPTGSFVAGDGNGANKSVLSLSSAALGSSNINIPSEAPLNVYESVASGSYCPSQNCALTGNFQKGYNPFYIMKYEVTQGGYVDFLNSSPPVIQTNHSPNQTGNNRNTVTFSNGVFSTTRPYRACNWLAWPDIGAYLNWAALRPLTELEYEKACRGSLGATIYENASGVSSATRAAAITGVNEDGTETVDASANACVGTTAFTGTGDGGQGPLRGGIFATASTSTRAQTGASYYGVMEMSGNVDEYYISAASGTSSGQSINGVSLSIGAVDSITGQFTNEGWPSPTFPNLNPFTNGTLNNIIHRGGNWNTTNLTGGSTAAQTYLNVSDRQGGSVATRTNGSGGRGGRSPYTGPLNGGFQIFSYTGASQTFTVPAGVTSIVIDAYGAQGGSGSTIGGLGGEMKGTYTVSGGTILQIYVGGYPGASTAGGFNGGGACNTTYSSGGYGGGGGSDVRVTPYAVGNRIIVAGGGGGLGNNGGTNTTGIGSAVAIAQNGNDWCSAGGGGVGGNSAAGTNGSSTAGGGAGGTGNQGGGGGGGGYTGGGALGTEYTSYTRVASTSGTLGLGGTGGSSQCQSNGGGGGGGYYGGGAGGNGACGGGTGGGGSSATIGTGWTGVSASGGVQTGNGKVVITW